MGLPCFWAETILLRLLNLRTMTSFRMFPRPDIVPDFPTGLAYGFALINALCIPRYVSSDQRVDGRATLGMILRPLTRRASSSVVFLIMFVRVWLVAACTNAATARFLTDYCPWAYGMRLGCCYFIL